MEKTTAERLKEALEIRNMKQVDLVEKTKIGKSAISQYISGKVIPKQDKIYLISKALNVDEGWLMGYDVPIERKDRHSLILNNSLLGFSEDAIEVAKSYENSQVFIQNIIRQALNLNLKNNQDEETNIIPINNLMNNEFANNLDNLDISMFPEDVKKQFHDLQKEFVDREILENDKKISS